MTKSKAKTMNILRFEHALESTRGLSKTLIAETLPRHFDSVGVGMT